MFDLPLHLAAVRSSIPASVLPVLILIANSAAADGLSSVGSTADGALLVTDVPGLQVQSSSDIRAVYSSQGEPLLAVGPAILSSDETSTSVSILGRKIGIDVATTFPRGIPQSNDYVAVTGVIETSAEPVADSVIRLGGMYSAGNSIVYLRGFLTDITATGTALLDGVKVDLAPGLIESQWLDSSHVAIVEVLGYEATDSAGQLLAALSVHPLFEIAADVSVQGITGSGVKGITGSGVKGITGSGIKSTNEAATS